MSRGHSVEWLRYMNFDPISYLRVKCICKEQTIRYAALLGNYSNKDELTCIRQKELYKTTSATVKKKST